MFARSLTSIAAGGIPNFLRKLRVAALLYGAVAVLVLTGAGFLIAAGYMEASARWGGRDAALAFGIAFIVLAILAILTIKMLARAWARRERQRKMAEADLIAGTAILDAFSAFLARRRHVRSLALPLAALVGYAVFHGIFRSDDKHRTRK